MSVLATAPQNILRAIVLTLAILYCIALSFFLKVWVNLHPQCTADLTERQVLYCLLSLLVHEIYTIMPKLVPH